MVKEADVVIGALSDWSCTSCGLHDFNELDKNGIPGVFLVTEEFQDAASIQCKALGFEPAIYWMPHRCKTALPKNSGKWQKKLQKESWK